MTSSRLFRALIRVGTPSDSSTFSALAAWEAGPDCKARGARRECADYDIHQSPVVSSRVCDLCVSYAQFEQ
eukprot:scaffold78035_cov62-Phaeocystis_antarctica.AAC.5